MIFQGQAGLTHDEIDEGRTFAPRFDANGLLTAVAVDASDGRVLMVGHMNAEALGKTLETGEVHYWSRSRNRLWKKGETSGEIQKLIEARTDCDQDVLLLTVEQAFAVGVVAGPGDQGPHGGFGFGLARAAAEFSGVGGLHEGRLNAGVHWLRLLLAQAIDAAVGKEVPAPVRPTVPRCALPSRSLLLI
jgi:phosphoribosyl-AMP cyclohydrolase